MSYNDASNYIDVLQRLTTDDERAQFKYFYNKESKSLLIAYLWLFFLGYFGFHKFYLNKKIAWLYVVLCFTGIPLFLVFIDMFLLPIQVTKYNQQLTVDLVDLIKVNSSNHNGIINVDKSLSRNKHGIIQWAISLLLVFMIFLPLVFYASMLFTHHRLELHYKSINPDGSTYDQVLTI